MGECKEAEAVVEEEELEAAGIEDVLHLRRQGTRSILPIRSLGTGAFAAVDLVSMPVGTIRKLLVAKRLSAAERGTAHNITHQEQPAGPLWPPAAALLKSSSEQDWLREAAMHRECAGCSFVVQLLAAKRCRTGDLLLLLEFAAQGSLTDVLAARSSSRLPEQATRFYAACILLALEWLHSRRIMHRDIKPCNLLLFADGYLKLADLGCCCQLPPGVEGAHTRTGTTEYLAPEVVEGDRAAYSYPVDMFALGIVIWQMADGELPSWRQQQQQQRQLRQQQQQQQFELRQQQQQQDGQQLQDKQQQQQQEEDEQQLEGKQQQHLSEEQLEHHHQQQQQQAVEQQWQGKQRQQQGNQPQQQQDEHNDQECGFNKHPTAIAFPDHFSEELRELLSGLLCEDGSARLSISEVQASSWFEGFDFQALADKTLTPPLLH